VAEEIRAAKVIHIKREIGDGNWFYATSPDLRGMLVAEATLAGLDKMIPQVITDLYAARGIEVYVVPLDEGADGNEGPRGAWVAVPAHSMKSHYRKPTPAAA
jgi:hypothetical protein